MRAPLAALLIPVALIAAACSDAPPTATPTPLDAPTATPPAAGTLRVAVTGAAPDLDLHRVVSEWATLFGPATSVAPAKL